MMTLAFAAWESAAKIFVLRNSTGQKMLYAAEESDSCERKSCDSKRGFVMHIIDNLGEVGFLSNLLSYQKHEYYAFRVFSRCFR